MLESAFRVYYAARRCLLDEIPLSVESGEYLVRPDLVQAFMISKVSRDSRRAAHTLGRELKVMNDDLIDYGWKRYICVLIVGNRLASVIPSHASPVVKQELGWRVSVDI